MENLLCQVCGGTADQSADGTLWLEPDYENKRELLTDGYWTSNPPVCIPCARLTLKHCPEIRAHGGKAIRVGRSTVVAVYGVLYPPFGPLYGATATVELTDPRIAWMQGSQLLREVHDLAFVSLELIID
jgi:hypothetical protein